MKTRDTDFKGALAALQRAAVKARQRAFDTTGSVAIVKDGRVVWQKKTEHSSTSRDITERGSTQQ